MRYFLLALASIALLLPGLVQGQSLPPNGDFEAASLEKWKTEGNVSLSADGAFEGKQSLLLQRAGDNLVDTSATSDPFPATPGGYEVSCAIRTDLYAQDMSFNGAVAVEFLDASGTVLQPVGIVVAQGKTAWKPARKKVIAPAYTATARVKVQFNKTHGRIWLDAVTFKPSADAVEAPLRVVFRTKYMGNMLYPEDRPMVWINVQSPTRIAEAGRGVTWDVRDYWNAPVCPPRTANLVEKGQTSDGKTWEYEATFDAADLPLRVGPYYELHASIRPTDAPAAEHVTTFAILPESSAFNNDPRQLPFGTHSWDDRQFSYFVLSSRLGLRNAAVFWSWPHAAPHTPDYKPGTWDYDGRIGWPKKYGLRPFTQLYPAMDREHNDMRHTDESLREGMRQTIEMHAKDGMWAHQIGNEPPFWDAKQVERDVEVYKILYETIKKTDPNQVVIGSAIGANEEFFKRGFQNYCDVYNIHAYSDLGELRRGMREYQKMFAKYGGKKPIWSTEIGSMSQGLTRHEIAMDIVRKASCFFADGGEFFCWFAITYPDPKGTRRGSYGDSMDLFAGYLEQYNPRLDAVGYFHYVDQMGVKRFVQEVTYPNGATGILFRDAQNNCLQVLWNLSGPAEDVTVSLADVFDVRATHIDGKGARLNADGKGVTVRISQEPVMLAYRQQAVAPLADAFAAPAMSIDDKTLKLFQGGSSELSIRVAKDQPGQVELEGPAMWTITPIADTVETDGSRIVKYRIDVPPQSPARAARLFARLADLKGQTRGELLLSPEVQSRITVDVLPIASTEPDKAAVELVVVNNGDEPQDVTWSVELVGEAAMGSGEFNLGNLQPADAYFNDVNEGKLHVAPKQESRVRLALSDVERQTVYRVRGQVIDIGGKAVVNERNMSGFVGVPKATITPDGSLDEPAWAKAPVLKIDEARQWFDYKKKPADWKGPSDLSADLRFLWDDKNLYVGVKTIDDIFNGPKSDGGIWSMDSLQILFDPYRDKPEKLGRYEYSFGVGTKGPQAWCALSADGRAPTGEAKEIVVTGTHSSDSPGGMVYEIAIPWTRIVPFAPSVGRDLGANLIVNEDDGQGRSTFLGWFSGVHNKTVSGVGDLILLGE